MTAFVEAAVYAPADGRERLWHCPMCARKLVRVEPPAGWVVLVPFDRVAACNRCLPRLAGTDLAAAAQTAAQRPTTAAPADADPCTYLDHHRGWWRRARCGQNGDNLEWLDGQGVEEQLEDCDRCPVRRACLAHAIVTRATDVVQGGIAIGPRPVSPKQWSRHE